MADDIVPSPGNLRPVDEGDRAPRINALDHTGAPAFPHADLVTGKPVVLVFCPAIDAPAAQAVLGRFRDLHDRFRALEATVFAVARTGVEANRAVHVGAGLPFQILADAEGGAFRAYGLAGLTATRPVVFVLDPAHRVARILDGAAAELGADALDYLERTFAPTPPVRLAAHPPVLVLPRMLSRADCDYLVETWHRPVGEWPSDGFTSAGHAEEKGDFKVRHEGAYGRVTEYVVQDAALNRFLDARLQRRIRPELDNAFRTTISRREHYRIAGYDADAGAVLLAHRDNPTAQTAHRRFTMTVNLNAGAYEGGELRFREYGDQLYAVEAGTAVIWSASLLHEVLPVTRGRRFVLGVHMFGT